MAPPTIPRKQTRQRRLGAYYTPEPIVRFMLRSCLNGPLAERLKDSESPMRILDPACGDGVFLLGALRELQTRGPAPDLTCTPRSTSDGYGGIGADLAAKQLFGVDVDSQAIRNLRLRIAEELGEPADVTRDPQEFLTANFRIGDSLSGPDSQSASQLQKKRLDPNLQTEISGIDWPRAFPHAVKAGGFDLVIGNPPYCSEKGARQLFRRLAETELGRRWQQPRMDLWHYFLHRGLDLLRSGGVLCYVVNAYWMSARSAGPLIERLRLETTVREVVLLGDASIFSGVTGRHMILQVQKAKSEEPCRVVDFSSVTDSSRLWEMLAGAEQSDGQLLRVQNKTPNDLNAFPGKALNVEVVSGALDAAKTWTVPQAALYRQGCFTPIPVSRRFATRRVRLLGDLCDVRQGIAENPPFVTRTIRDALGGEFEVGAGVFVLTADEVQQLELAPRERVLLRPHYSAKSIGRYHLPPMPTHWMLYLTRVTAPALSTLPRIAGHLERFRPVLERRREVQRGCINWWHLHWPREERLFLEPRILAVQMGRHPRFVYVERPAFVGFAVNLVRAKEQAPLRLPAATAVLNSAGAAEWFSQHAKRRGAALDISGTVLRAFPFPEFDGETAEQLADLCRRRQQCGPPLIDGTAPGLETATHEAEALECAIERLL